MSSPVKSALALLSAAACAATIAVAPAQAAPTKPHPTPFPIGVIATVYPSDVSSHGGIYYDIVDGFNDLRDHHPAVLKQNLQTVIDINQAAKNEPAVVNRALADEHDDLLETMSDALGTRVGAQFRAALTAGRLPKTEQLLAGTLARGGGVASSTFPEKLVFNYPRPFVVAPNKITQFHRPGESGPYQNDPLSTSFPSGHTNQATWKAMLWALMLPEFGQPLLARAQEVGYHRMVMGVHYPLDVIGG
ncbi:MAG: phosphatase PAP2 family protein, partial [Gordonia sp. (in: high G+C Gram-positive bacteria)]